MNKYTKHQSQHVPRVLLLLALALTLVLLAGCRAEDGIEGATQVDRDVFLPEVETILAGAGCNTLCHQPGSPTDGAYCDGCHAPGKLQTDIATLNGAGMVGVTTMATTNGKKIVLAGSSADSMLYWVINQNGQYTTDGGGMLTFMNSLTPDERGIVKAWIDQGANP